jgi:hypothetical protein
MNQTRIEIELDKKRLYEPGDFLICEFQIELAEDLEIKVLESSVLWSTEGKGEQDIGVHFFERKKSLPSAAYLQRQKLSTVLPATPLSYWGRILKVDWFVRVKIFLANGKTITENRQFQLGSGCNFDAFNFEESENESENDDTSA